MLPFAIDMFGNFANLYDTIDWWDDVNHLVNWAILSLGARPPAGARGEGPAGRSRV